MASELRVDKIHNEGGDNDSGLDMSTNDVVAVKIAGSEKVRVHSDGKLGVGTASPSYNVHSVTTSGSDYAGFFHNSSASGNSTGLVVKGGANNTGAGTFIVQDYSGNTDLMVDGNGHVTMPNQSAFSVTSGTEQSNIALATETTVVYGTEIFDQNSDFSSNTFTAPVTGKYMLGVRMRVDNLDKDATYFYVIIVTSNRSYYNLTTFSSLGSDQVYHYFQVTQLADMDANDTAVVKFYQPDGTQQADIHGAATAQGFWGYLVA